jgi:hypothetical protein
VAAAAPVRVRDRLRAAGDREVPVVHRGAQAVYLDLDGWCLGVLASTATAVPCALRVAAPDLGDLSAGEAHVTGGVLHLAGTPLRIGRLVDVTVPPLALPGPVVDLPADFVAARIGRGDGLTPYGDDVLCGWLAIHRAAGLDTPSADAAVRAALDRTTLLSATLLDCALHGEVVPEFAAYVAALGTDREQQATDTLARIGHSSGRGLLEGARLALHQLGHQVGRSGTHEGTPAA